MSKTVLFHPYLNSDCVLFFFYIPTGNVIGYIRPEEYALFFAVGIFIHRLLKCIYHPSLEVMHKIKMGIYYMPAIRTVEARVTNTVFITAFLDALNRRSAKLVHNGVCEQWTEQNM